MHELTAGQLLSVLEELGLQSGDGLLIHSAIQFLGRPAGGLGMYLQALQELLGPQGTFAVPAFNFAFARGEPYDPHTTPAAGMGALAEYVRCRPEARRSPHPLQSLAAIGWHAADIASRDTPSAFDPGSPFERLLELDFKLLLLGADIQAVSMIHYSEPRAAVPYRYWKEFRGPVKTPAGWETRTYRMYVRDRAIDARLDLHPLQDLLQSRQQWRTQPLHYGAVSVCRLRDFVAAADQLLAGDPWVFVTNRPQPI